MCSNTIVPVHPTVHVTQSLVFDSFRMLGSYTHSLMYFNAFFTSTKSVQVITCCFHSVDEKNYWPINLFTSCMHIYFDATTLICALNESQNSKSLSHIAQVRQRVYMGRDKRDAYKKIVCTRIAIVYRRSTNRKWVFECSLGFFASANRWPQYKSRDMRYCGFTFASYTILHAELFIVKLSGWSHARKTFWITLSEHSLESSQTLVMSSNTANNELYLFKLKWN